ncbi:MAG: hypothetical protein AAFU73_00395 [Planctomycetota bacterium]
MIPHIRPAHVLRGSKGSVAWWGALVAILAFAVVAKTGTVGAPVLARTHPDAAPAARPVLFADARERAERAQDLEAEVALLRSRLAFEQRRSALLARGVDSLNARAAAGPALPYTVAPAAAAAVPSTDAASSGARLPSAPVPVEAIYVRPSAGSALSAPPQRR